MVIFFGGDPLPTSLDLYTGEEGLQAAGLVQLPDDVVAELGEQWIGGCATR